jgi:hypothetical protein
MLSFSISYLDLNKFPYSADTTQRGESGIGKPPRKAGLLKRKETHPEWQHLLFHSKVKPTELHHHVSYSQNLA